MAGVRTVTVTETYKVPDLVGNVERGLKMLDKELGPEWVKKVDSDVLDLADSEHCVVGQLAIKSMLNGPLDGYSDGLEKLPTAVQTRPDRFGFTLPDDIGEQIVDLVEKDIHHPWWPMLHGNQMQDEVTRNNLAIANAIAWDYMTAIWRQVIKERLKHLRSVARARKQAEKAVAPRKTTARKTAVKKSAAKKTTARRR